MFKNFKKHHVLLIAVIPLLFLGLAACDKDEKSTVITISQGERAPIQITGFFPADESTVSVRRLCQDGQDFLRWNTIQDAIQETDDDDRLYFDVYFGTTETPPLIYQTDATEEAQTIAVSWGDFVDEFDGTLDRLDSGTTYYWKVVVTDVVGNTSASEVLSFTTSTNDCPEEPVLTGGGYPADGTTDVNVLEEFRWRAPQDYDEDAIECSIYIGTTPALTTSIATSIKPYFWDGANYLFKITPSDYTDLEPNTTYYWKVDVYDMDDGETTAACTTPSELWRFTTSSVDDEGLTINTDFMTHDGNGDLSASVDDLDQYYVPLDPDNSLLEFSAGAAVNITMGAPYPSLALAVGESVSLENDPTPVNPFNGATLTFDVLIDSTAEGVRVQMESPAVAGQIPEMVDFIIFTDDNTYGGDTDIAASVVGTADLENTTNFLFSTAMEFTITDNNPVGATTRTVSVPAGSYTQDSLRIAIEADLNQATAVQVTCSGANNNHSLQLVHDVAGDLTDDPYQFSLTPGTNDLLAFLGIILPATPATVFQNYAASDTGLLRVFAQDYHPGLEDVRANRVEIEYASANPAFTYGIWNRVIVTFTNNSYTVSVNGDTGSAVNRPMDLSINNGSTTAGDYTSGTMYTGETLANIVDSSDVFYGTGLIDDFTITAIGGTVHIDNLVFNVTEANYER